MCFTLGWKTRRRQLLSYVLNGPVGVPLRLIRGHGDDGDAHIDSQDVDVEETEEGDDDQQIAAGERLPRPFRRTDDRRRRLHGDEWSAVLLETKRRE